MMHSTADASQNYNISTLLVNKKNHQNGCPRFTLPLWTRITEVKGLIKLANTGGGELNNVRGRPRGRLMTERSLRIYLAVI